MNETKFIRVYENVIQSDVCKYMIDTYEKLWREQEDQIKRISLCYTEDGTKTCGACDCQRLDIMQHHEFKESFKYVITAFQAVIKQYKKDVGIQEGQFPEKYAFENLRIKRYLCDDKQEHGTHVDINNVDSAKRFLSIVSYLNDDFDEGETEFPQYNYRTKVSTGSIVLFPCGWNYLHKGNKPKNGYAKYMLGSFLNYTIKQNFNRIGDKTLGTATS